MRCTNGVDNLHCVPLVIGQQTYNDCSVKTIHYINVV